MAQFDDLKEQLEVFVDGVSSALDGLTTKLASFQIDTGGVKDGFDILSAELLRVAILFEAAAQKITSFTNAEAKSADAFDDKLDASGAKLEKTADNVSNKFDSSIVDITGASQKFADQIKSLGDKLAIMTFDEKHSSSNKPQPDFAFDKTAVEIKLNDLKSKQATDKEWTNENNEKPKAGKGAGTFEKLALSSEAVGKAMANLGANIYQVQNTIKGSGAVFGMISKASDMVIGNLFKVGAAAAFFVNAFNPALVQNFMYTLKDLQAVIGAGLQPIITALTVSLRFFADTLVPVVQALAPALNSLGDMITGFLTPIFAQIGATLLVLSDTLNGTVGPAFAELAYRVGEFIGEMIKAFTPIINVLLKMFGALAVVVSYVVRVLSEFAPIIAGVLTGFAVLIGVNAVAAIVTFIASLLAAASVMTLGLAAVIGAIAGFLGWLFTKKQDESQGLTNESQGMAARKAEYSKVEDLSKNLIKAAFAGSAEDKLKNIDNNGKRQVELLEKIAKEKKVVAPANRGDNAGLIRQGAA